MKTFHKWAFVYIPLRFFCRSSSSSHKQKNTYILTTIEEEWEKKRADQAVCMIFCFICLLFQFNASVYIYIFLLFKARRMMSPTISTQTEKKSCDFCFGLLTGFRLKQEPSGTSVGANRNKKRMIWFGSDEFELNWHLFIFKIIAFLRCQCFAAHYEYLLINERRKKRAWKKGTDKTIRPTTMTTAANDNNIKLNQITFPMKKKQTYKIPN